MRSLRFCRRDERLGPRQELRVIKEFGMGHRYLARRIRQLPSCCAAAGRAPWRAHA